MKNETAQITAKQNIEDIENLFTKLKTKTVLTAEREHALVVTKMQEALHWAKAAFEKIAGE